MKEMNLLESNQPIDNGLFWVLQNNDGLYFENISPTGRVRFTSEFNFAHKFFYCSKDDLDEAILLENKLKCKRITYNYIKA